MDPAQNTVINNLPRETPVAKIRGFLPRVLLALAVLVIAYEVYLGVKTLTAPVPRANELQPLSGGKIALISTKISYRVGDVIPVLATVSTGGHISVGTDIILKYDPAILEASASSFFRKGRIYEQYPNVSLDSRTGIIKASGITSGGKSGFNGGNLFGTFILRARKEGKTNISIDFKKGATNDSNMVEAGKLNDILDKVYNLDIVITKI